MAIDTRSKRQSCLGLGLSFLRTWLVPDGTIGTSDRLHLDFLYAGIAASAPTDQTITADSISIHLYIEQSRSQTFYVEQSRRLDRYIEQSRSISVER